jgi:G:T-mismatch repair DNA endonuclease (very short patch repair protein)
MYVESIAMYVEGIAMYVESIAIYVDGIAMYVESINSCTFRTHAGVRSTVILLQRDSCVFVSRCFIGNHVTKIMQYGRSRANWLPKSRNSQHAMRKLALYILHSPIHQSYYSQFA